MSRKLLKSTATVGSATTISRVLGFIRDMVIAHIFGSTTGFDAFLIAFKIPNLMRRIVGEGAFSQVFVPTLAEYKENETKEDVKNFIDSIAGSLSIFLLIITILGIILSPIIVKAFAPGFDSDDSRLYLAVYMLRVTFPYMFFISLVSLYGGILNTYGSFAVPALAPVFLNLSLIGSALFLAPNMDVPIYALAFGVLIAGFVQFLFPIYFLVKKGFFPKPKLNWQHKGVRQVLRLMVPAIIGVSVYQINSLIDTVFASFLEEGSITWLYYADRLMEFPLGIFGIALATVVLPSLSKDYVNKSLDEYSKTLDWAIRWVLIIGVPALIGLYLLSGPIISTLFKTGKFKDYDVSMAMYALKAYSFGLIGLMLVKVLASAYYAKKDIKTPVKIAFVAVIINISCNFILIGPYQHTGLAISTSISAIANCSLLFIGLLRSKSLVIQNGWLLLLLRLALACTILFTIVSLLNPQMDEWNSFRHLERAIKLASIIGISGLAYVITLYVTGVRLRHLLVKVN